jgi:2-polyprenyl-3-methyl-5-hydroxy-6-metoxy-1,4-benzoquinol methylase
MPAPERLLPGTREWNLYHVEHEQRYKFAAPYCKGKTVLDVACGVGYGSRILAASGARNVVGVDVSESAIQYAQRHFSHPNVEFVCCSIEDLGQLKAQFDVLVSFETIEHLPDPGLLLRQSRHVLSPRAKVICSTPNTDFDEKGVEANPYHLSEMTYSQFEELFSNNFTITARHHQSHSAGYSRHVQLVRQMEQLDKVVQTSKGLAIENWVRNCLGRYAWPRSPMPSTLYDAVPGDYVIESIDSGVASHLTFIFVGVNDHDD